MFKKLFKLTTALEIITVYSQIKETIANDKDVFEAIKVEIDKIIDALKAIQNLLPELKIAIQKIIDVIKGLLKK